MPLLKLAHEGKRCGFWNSGHNHVPCAVLMQNTGYRLPTILCDPKTSSSRLPGVPLAHRTEPAGAPERQHGQVLQSAQRSCGRPPPPPPRGSSSGFSLTAPRRSPPSSHRQAMTHRAETGPQEPERGALHAHPAAAFNSPSSCSRKADWASPQTERLL